MSPSSEAIFAKHPGVKIAVAGSYGKTTMKELLNTVLGRRHEGGGYAGQQERQHQPCPFRRQADRRRRCTDH